MGVPGDQVAGAFSCQRVSYAHYYFSDGPSSVTAQMSGVLAQPLLAGCSCRVALRQWRCAGAQRVAMQHRVATVVPVNALCALLGRAARATLGPPEPSSSVTSPQAGE